MQAMFRTLLQLFGIGLFIGAILGLFACAVLSSGHASFGAYLIFGGFGAAVGVVGSLVAGVLIAIMRYADSVIKKHQAKSLGHDVLRQK
jgi:hypothetical protein